jgi:hypothetical protein
MHPYSFPALLPGAMMVEPLVRQPSYSMKCANDQFWYLYEHKPNRAPKFVLAATLVFAMISVGFIL